MIVAVLGMLAYKVKVMVYYEASISKMNEFLFQPNAETSKLSFKENGLSLLVAIRDLNRSKYYNDKKYGSFLLAYTV